MKRGGGVDGWREGGRVGGSEGEKEREREIERERERERERELRGARARDVKQALLVDFTRSIDFSPSYSSTHRLLK